MKQIQITADLLAAIKSQSELMPSERERRIQACEDFRYLIADMNKCFRVTDRQANAIAAETARRLGWHDVATHFLQLNAKAKAERPE